jgi:hypothetical protein
MSTETQSKPEEKVELDQDDFKLLEAIKSADGGGGGDGLEQVDDVIPEDMTFEKLVSI